MSVNNLIQILIEKYVLSIFFLKSYYKTNKNDL